MERPGMMGPMGMPSMPMPMGEMHRRMATVMMEYFWHLTHYQSRHFHHYLTQPGDTLNAVADRLGVPKETIGHWNCLPPGAELPPGILLTVPCEMKMKM